MRPLYRRPRRGAKKKAGPQLTVGLLAFTQPPLKRVQGGASVGKAALLFLFAGKSRAAFPTGAARPPNPRTHSTHAGRRRAAYQPRAAAPAAATASRAPPGSAARRTQSVGHGYGRSTTTTKCVS